MLNKAIKILALLLVFASLMPPQLSGWIELAGRFIYWKPKLAMQRLDIGIMYLGYLAIIAQLLIEFLRQIVHAEWAVSVSIHVFTFGVTGLIIPAMLIRIAKKGAEGASRLSVELCCAFKRNLPVGEYKHSWVAL
jgi:uncharacterized protein involved in response to NO